MPRKKSVATPGARKTELPEIHAGLRQRLTLRGHTGPVLRMALSPDGRLLASPSADGSIRVWDCQSGKVQRVLGGDSRHPVDAVAWSPDGRILASGDHDNLVKLWDPIHGELIAVLRGHVGWVMAVAWHPDGATLASGSRDCSVRLWDVPTKAAVRELLGHAHCVQSVAWSATGKLLCSGAWDGTVRIWDHATGKRLQTLDEHSEQVFAVAWSPDGRWIASGSYDRTVRVWDAESGRQAYVLEGHTGPVAAVSFMDDGRLLASIGNNGLLITWRTDTWVDILHAEKMAQGDLILGNLAAHPSLPVLATPIDNQTAIGIWGVDLQLLRKNTETATTFYVNAKAVLLGESGAGKSGLGLRIATGEFLPTEGSTHGAQFWHFPAEKLPALPANVRAELFGTLRANPSTADAPTVPG